MRRPFIPPDWFDHLKKMLRRYGRDLANRAGRVDIQALAADWEVKGVDISYWNGEIKDPELFASMVDFVFIRAGYGNDFIDPRLDEYRAVCETYSIPFGLYWFTKPGKSFEKHALNFYNTWTDHPGKLPPVFDDEDDGGLKKTPLESWLLKLYNAFNSLAALKYPDEITYTSPGFLNRAIALTSWMKHTLLWVAHWTLGSQPILPNEWAIPGFTWTFWQWSATGKGADYGVSSRYIDLNRYNGTREQFEAEFGLEPSPPPPPPPGDEMKYRVLADGLKIRSQPNALENNIIGTRSLNDVVIPLETIGDSRYPAAYWVRDERGWSAAQYYNPTQILMRSFV